MVAFAAFATACSMNLPDTVEAYRAYRDASVAFIEARNRRIDALT